MRVGDDAIGTVVPPRHPQGYRRRAGQERTDRPTPQEGGPGWQLRARESRRCLRAVVRRQASPRVDPLLTRAVHTTSDFGATELVEVVCGQQWSVLVGDTRQEPLDRSPWSDPDNRRDV